MVAPKPTPKTVYKYDKATGEFLGEYIAQPNPKEAGKHLIPTRCVEVAPPAAGENETAVWNGEAWTLVEDHRGTVRYSTVDGSKISVEDLGPLPADSADTAPAEFEKWDEQSGAWVIDQPALDVAIISALKAARIEEWHKATITLETETDANGAVLKAKSRDDILATISGMEIAIKLGLPNADIYPGWCAENGVYTMTLGDFKQAVVLGFPKIQAVFNAYSAASPEYNNVTYTSVQEALAAFYAALNPSEPE